MPDTNSFNIRKEKVNIVFVLTKINKQQFAI